jgi:hypothetical protein
MTEILREKMTQVVLDSLAELNEQFKPEQRLPMALSTALYGSSSTLTSTDLVSFIVGVEQRLEEQHQIHLTIVDDRALARKSSPFRSVESLVTYICERLEEKKTDA